MNFFDDDEEDENVFRSKDLELCDFQYAIVHLSADKFTVGEKVFLKSNPEVNLTVVSISDEELICKWKNDDSWSFGSFVPHCLLQYEHRPLLVYKRKFNICLN